MKFDKTYLINKYLFGRGEFRVFKATTFTNNIFFITIYGIQYERWLFQG